MILTGDLFMNEDFCKNNKMISLEVHVRLTLTRRFFRTSTNLSSYLNKFQVNKAKPNKN